MKKLELDDAASIAIREKISEVIDPRHLHRLYALLFLSAGLTCQQVADTLGEDRSTVQRWVNRFQSDGPDGLQSRQPSGRPPKLNPEQMERLRLDFAGLPSKFGYKIAKTGSGWTENMKKKHILSKYEKLTLSDRTVERILKSLKRKP